ncbi:MAG TPA: hypothetical protein VIQ00_05800 [Chitinophagaceae bacterium]
MIIGIGGVSRAGKTSLSGFLKKNLGRKCVEIHLDSYIKDSSHWDFFMKYPIFYLSSIHKMFDMEHPDVIDFNRLYEDIIRSNEENEIVIAEGFLITHDPRIKNLIDCYIHVAVNKEEFIKRRTNDYKKSNSWYANHVWKSFMKYGNNYNGLNYMVVDANNEMDTDSVLAFININQHLERVGS